MIVSAVLCPHPPLLFRELSGRQDVAADLRRACHDVLTEALATQPDAVVVVGAADEARTWTGVPDVRSFGATQPRTAGEWLPLSLGVGQRLLEETGWTGPTELVSLGWDATDHDVDGFAADATRRGGRVVLLALGDGSTRRGDKAPGYLDERAFPFDQATAKALEAGDAHALRCLDVALADELMVLGRTAFRVLGACGAPKHARLAYDHDPFGVAYHVALWRYL